MKNRVRIGELTARTRQLLGLVAAAATVTLGACAKDGDAKPSTVSANPGAEDLPSVLASIGDQDITMADVRTRLGTPLAKLEAQFQRSRSKMVDSVLQVMVTEKVIQKEAERTGKSIEELLAAEADGGLEPNDADIMTWYQDNQLRLGGRSLESLRPQIVEYVRAQRRQDAAKKLQARLTKELNVAVKFQPFRLAFQNGNAPMLGKEGAEVEVVEFSDFQCPFCQRFAPTLKQIANQYGDKVHIVYRQFPIPSLHPNAMKAAEASLCAHEQGKFWELHDVLFNEQDRLNVSDLKEKAGRLGLNQKKFNSCLDTGKYVEQVQNDIEEGIRSGVGGTPAVFINGVVLEGGAVPYETVTAAIDRELARIKK